MKWHMEVVVKTLKYLAIGWLCLIAVFWIAGQMGYDVSGRAGGLPWGPSAKRTYAQCTSDNPNYAGCEGQANRTNIFTGGQ